MTVAQLIKHLEKLPQDGLVLASTGTKEEPLLRVISIVRVPASQWLPGTTMVVIE